MAFDNLRADSQRLREIKSKGYPWYILESLLFENGFQAVVMHRLAHWFKSLGLPVLGPLVARLNLFLTGADIAPAAQIGPGLMISHGVGLVVGNRVRIGSGATLLQQVTLGAPSIGRIAQMPSVGDGVFIAAGARLIGGITVGDGVFVGANALVAQDVPAQAKVTAEQTLRIKVRADARADRPTPEIGQEAPEQEPTAQANG